MRGSAIPGHQRAIRLLQRRLQPPLYIQLDPSLVGVAGDRLEHEVVGHGVEGSCDSTTRIEDLATALLAYAAVADAGGRGRL